MKNEQNEQVKSLKKVQGGKSDEKKSIKGSKHFSKKKKQQKKNMYLSTAVGHELVGPKRRTVFFMEKGFM